MAGMNVGGTCLTGCTKEFKVPTPPKVKSILQKAEIVALLASFVIGILAVRGTLSPTAAGACAIGIGGALIISSLAQGKVRLCDFAIYVTQVVLGALAVAKIVSGTAAGWMVLGPAIPGMLALVCCAPIVCCANLAGAGAFSRFS